MKDDARSTLEKVNQMFPELKGYESIERVSNQISSMSGEDSDIFKDIKNQIQKLEESDVKALTGLMRQIKNNQKVFEEQLKVCGYEAALMSDDYQLIISRYNECLTLLQDRLAILDVCMPDDLNLLVLSVVMALPVSGASRAREYRCNPLKGSTLQAEASVVEDHDGQGFSFQGFSGRFDECFPRHERWLSTMLTEQYNKVYERKGPCSDRDVKDLIQCYHTGISNLFEEHQFYLNQSVSQARFLKRRLSGYLRDMRDKINQILDRPQLSLLNDHKAGFQFVILRMFNEHNDMAKCFQANIKASLPSEDRPSKRARASVEHFNHSHSIGIQPVIQACLCFDDFGTPCSEMGALVLKLKSTVRASLSESDPQRPLLFCLLDGLSDKITRLKCPDDLKVELDQFNKIHTMSPTHNNFRDMLFKIDTLWNQWLDTIDLTHHKDALLEFKKAYTAIDSVISEQLKHLDRSSEDYHSCKKIGEDSKQSVRECCDYLKALLPKKAKDQKTEAVTYVPSKRAQSDGSSNLDALKGVNKRGTPEVKGNKRRSVVSRKGRRSHAQKVEIPVAVRSHPPSSYALKGNNKKQGQPVLEKGQPILENSNAISNAIESRVFDPAVHLLVELSQSYTKSSQLKDVVSSSLPQLSVVLGPDKASRLIRPTTILGSLVQAPDQCLIQAAESGDIDQARNALNRGASVNAINETNGDAALILGALNGHKNIVDVLIAHDVSLDVQDQNGDTALMWAVGCAHKSIVEALINAGADVNARSKNGLTALTWAVKNSDEDLVKLFIDQGAQLGSSVEEQLWIKEKNKRLIQSAQLGDVDQTRNALKCGANVNAQNKNDWTALMSAAYMGHIEVVSILLKAGATVDVSNQCVSTVLMFASEKGHTGVVSILLKAGATVDAANQWGSTALMFASEKGHAATVSALLKAGANVNARRKNGSTALMLASENGYAATVSVLLEAGANVEASNVLGETALMYAASNGHAACVKALLQAGANLEAFDDLGMTALMYAAEKGDEACVIALLRAGANVDADSSSMTALMYAAGNGHAACVKALLQAGANLEAFDDSGMTALMYAA
ncbi:MAG: hypothetical protein CMF51_00005, partial [Legionellales bacterium]|nr:hypothetical protein [Legionellales bacterium]